MRTLAQRRTANLMLASLASLIILLIWWVWGATLIDVAYRSGLLLLLLVVFLAAYNLRKKIPVLPMLSSATWLQLHIYVGLVSILVFLLHVRFRLPTGWLEGLLAMLYGLTALSGIVGLIITRLFARRLARNEEEMIFERLPAHRFTLRREMRELMMESVRAENATTISEFCRTRLVDFFDGPRCFWTHVFGLRRGSHPLVLEALALERYLKPAEREILGQVIDRIRKKDDLDFQHALQKALKLWMFVHIPLTYGLLVFAFVHMVLVFAFGGG